VADHASLHESAGRMEVNYGESTIWWYSVGISTRLRCWLCEVSRECGLQAPVQDIDCDELYEREETKEGFIMGYGKSTVCHFDTRVVMGADCEAS
jgi:hypothetical protein